MYKLSVIFANFTSGVFLEKFSQNSKFWNSKVCYSSHRNLSFVSCWPRKQSLNLYVQCFKIYFLLSRLLWYKGDNNSGLLLINTKHHSLEFLHNIHECDIHVFENIRYVSFDHIIFVWSWGGYLSVPGKLLVSSRRWKHGPCQPCCS